MNLSYIVVLGLSVSCLLSNYTGVDNKGNSFSFQKKNKGVIKGGETKDLKFELMQLEKDFKLDYDEIKSNYKEKILALKEMQKTEVKGLKKNYNNRRKAIYKKYGVKPPKKNEGNSMKGSDLVKPAKRDKNKQSPVKRSLK